MGLGGIFVVWVGAALPVAMVVGAGLRRSGALAASAEREVDPVDAEVA